MGLTTTTTHIVWFFTILAVASSTSQTYWTTAATVDDAREARENRVAARLETSLSGASWCYNPTLQRVNATAINAGVTLNASQVTILVDGTPESPMARTVWGAPSGTNTWHRNENASWNKTGVTPAPSRVVMVTETGGFAFPVFVVCREIVAIVITPPTRTLQVGQPYDFSAQAYDAANQPITGFHLTFSTTTGTISNVNDTVGRLVSGTTPGTFTVTATHDDISGTAIVTLMPGPPAMIEVAPSPVDVVAAETQQFSATLRDSYNNVNTTATPTWTTNAGAITSSGLLTAQTVAATGKTVAATFGSVSGQSIVNVVPGPLHHVAVTPSSATVLTKSVTLFVAQGYDEYNNPKSGLAYSWSATTGSITNAGAYTAPATVGSGSITVTSGAYSATAVVTIERNIRISDLKTYKDGVPSATFSRVADRVETRVTIVDHNNTVVSGATVRLVLTDSNGAQRFNTTAVTSASGIATFSSLLLPTMTTGVWKDEVMTLTGPSLRYVPEANVVRLITFTVT